MSTFLTLDSLSAQTVEGRQLFNDLTLSVGAERTGLVGRNGSGKSTALRIAAGLQKPSAGSVGWSGTFALLEQHWPEAWTVAEALGVADQASRIARVVSGEGSEDDFDLADWTLEDRIAAALIQIDLAGLPLDRIVGSLSGGERVRVGIARLLIEQPNILLLDEPTNNLDISGREAVQDLVANWGGGILLASHDRMLLETMDRIVELNPLGVSITGGGWSAFMDARNAERERRAAEVARADASLRQTKHTAQARQEGQDRRDKAGRAFAATGSQPNVLLGKNAERAENSAGRSKAESGRSIADAAQRVTEARANVEVVVPLVIELPATGLPSAAGVAKVTGAHVQLGERDFGPWNITIKGPERIALKGANGAGKTTFLKLISGELGPTSGSVKCLHDRVAVLDQHVGVLDWSASVLDNVRRLNPELSQEQAYATCARFAFRNRRANQTVETLSGGERMRAGLAAIFARRDPPWLLVLDEPTNHLDVESTEVLEAALRDFDGALLMVSHDQTFVTGVGVDRTITI